MSLIKNGFIINDENRNLGIIAITSKPNTKRYKVRISYKNTQYTHDLNNKGETEVFPLQMGNGKYTVTIYQQVTNNKYKTLFSTFHNVKYNNENIVFLQSNKYVAYTHNSLAVIKANELSTNLIEEKQKADIIINYITKTFLYDHIKAITMPTTGTYVPDLEQIMKTRKGICFDLAALVCCMMRSQGIPTKMVIGDTDRGYHAWNKIYINNRWLLVDVTNKIAAMDIKRYSPKLYY